MEPKKLGRGEPGFSVNVRAQKSKQDTITFFYGSRILLNSLLHSFTGSPGFFCNDTRVPEMVKIVPALSRFLVKRDTGSTLKVFRDSFAFKLID